MSKLSQALKGITKKEAALKLADAGVPEAEAKKLLAGKNWEKAIADKVDNKTSPGLAGAVKTTPSKQVDSDPFKDANLSDIATSRDMDRGFTRDISDVVPTSEPTKLSTPKEKRDYSKWLLGGGAAGGLGLALMGDDSGKEDQPLDQKPELADLQKEKFASQPARQPVGEPKETTVKKEDKLPTKVVNKKVDVLQKEVEKELDKQGVPDFARKDFYTELKKQADNIFNKQREDINSAELIGNLIEGLGNIFAGAYGYSEGIPVGQISVTKPDWRSRRDDIRTLYKTALEEASIVQDAEDARVAAERKAYERQQDREWQEGRDEKSRRHSLLMQARDLAEKRAGRLSREKLAKDKAKDKAVGKWKSNKALVKQKELELQAVNDLLKGKKPEDVKGALPSDALEKSGIFWETIETVTDKEQLLGLRDKLTGELQAMTTAPTGDNTTSTQPANTSPYRQDVADYAKQYGLDYNAAYTMLKNRGDI